MKIYSALYDNAYPFDQFAPDHTVQAVDNEYQLDDGHGYLIVWGGQDIHPSLYERPDISSQVGETVSRRDTIEWNLIHGAIERRMPIVGICRGAQMLCAAVGGVLAQHVTGHTQDHLITTITGESMITSSLHHQMMYPFDKNNEPLGEILAWSKPRSNVYVGLSDEEAQVYNESEPEVVWFPQVKGLAIQGHPEFMHMGARFVEYTKNLMKEYIYAIPA